MRCTRTSLVQPHRKPARCKKKCRSGYNDDNEVLGIWRQSRQNPEVEGGMSDMTKEILGHSEHGIKASALARLLN